jgi:hypothetical protein
MKAFYFFSIATFFIVSTSAAQITINRSDDFSTIGSNILYGCDSYFANTIGVGSAGADRTWDYSSLINSFLDSIKYFSPDQTPYFSDFANADFAIYKNVVGLGDGYYYYKNITNDSVNLLGIGQGVAFHSSEDLEIYPLSYGKSRSYNSTETYKDVSYDPNFDSIMTIDYTKQTLIQDGWGLVILPGYRTFNALRTKEIVTDSTISYIRSNGIWIVDPSTPASYDTAHIYYWNAKGIAENLLTLEATSDDQIYLSQYYLGTSCDITEGRRIHGTVKTSNGSILSGTKVYHIKYSYSRDSLFAVDSTISDLNGDFDFDNTIDSTINGYVWVCPDTSQYPDELPTYFGDSYTIQHSSVITYSCDTTKAADLRTIKRGNDSGPCILEGIVNTTNGNPVNKLRIYIADSLNVPVRTTLTDEAGYFKCMNLPSGKYKIMVDKPLVNNFFAPLANASLPLSSKIQSFTLYKTYLAGPFASASISSAKTSLDNIKIYPNPASSVLNVISNSAADFSYSLMSVSGKLIKEGRIQSSIDISSLEKGIYILKIQSEDGVGYKKVIVE